MVRISQRDLRNKSAEILRDLETTGEAEVTSNNRPVAILSPLQLSSLERMLRSGQARSAKATSLPRVPRLKASEPTLDILNDLKGDR